MVQLKYLYIEDCKVMEEVLLTEDLGEEEIIPKVLFPRLEDLVLKDLPVLKRFCVVSNIKFPSLKDMVIEKCPKLESFIFKPVSSGMTLSKELKEVNSEEISQTAMQPLFNEEVAFPNLESLLISHMPNLEIIWHDKFAPSSYTKLQSMDVQFCESLMNIFQVNMLSRFQSLESLVVGDCGSLQEIFELEGQEVTETQAVTVTQLKKLCLRRLPKLKRVWNKDPQETFSFPNLQQISVWKCESLKSLFPTSVARCLKQLDDLRIAECGIEEIIEQEEGAKEDARFVFPKLTLLMLRELSKLKWFYRGVHTSEWPLLESLEVSGSNEIQVFASKNYRIQEQDDQSQLETSIQQPLFLVEEVAFPSLKKLFLRQCVLEDIAMIGELRNLEILSLLDSNVQQLPRETGLLTHLQILDLRNCTKLKVIPPNVLSCLIQLEELYVGDSFTQWDVEGLNNERASLAELKHLSRLTTLEVHIPDANMLPKDLLFEKLQRYKIFVGDVWDWSDCPKHSRALKLKLNSSFHLERGIKMLLNGIENLCLDELKGVKSVIDELDTTGFQQLKHLHVQNNVEIKYIINSRGMVISDVVFPVLEMLSLKNMINLEEICHGQIPSASFRNLSIIKVLICDKLKILVPLANILPPHNSSSEEEKGFRILMMEIILNMKQWERDL
nr:disease resistance protein [Quercus suber]